jgi:hypothetical protein
MLNIVRLDDQDGDGCDDQIRDAVVNHMTVNLNKHRGAPEATELAQSTVPRPIPARPSD